MSLGYVSLAWVALAFKFKETVVQLSPIPSPKKMAQQYKELPTFLYFMSFAIIGWLNFSLMITTVSVMPFIMQNQIGMTSDEYAMWLFFCPLKPVYLMLGQFLMILGNGIALPCAQALVMLPYKKNAGAAAAMSGGGQMVVSSLVSMGLVKLGLGEAWHLSLVIALFTAITLLNILRGFGSQEARDAQLS